MREKSSKLHRELNDFAFGFTCFGPDVMSVPMSLSGKEFLASLSLFLPPEEKHSSHTHTYEQLTVTDAVETESRERESPV